jgi:hypothetical protein
VGLSFGALVIALLVAGFFARERRKKKELRKNLPIVAWNERVEPGTQEYRTNVVGGLSELETTETIRELEGDHHMRVESGKAYA